MFEPTHERVKRMFLEDVESFLNPLDERAWHALRQRIIPYLKRKDGKRGWPQFLEKINEARGYGHLISLGCENVEFIEEVNEKGIETPDLKGTLGRRLVLCEVKTVNISDAEVDDRLSKKLKLYDGNSAPFTLKFMEKITATVQKAINQLNAFSSEGVPRKIVYLVVHVDDAPYNENEHHYSQQLANYLSANNFMGYKIAHTFAKSYYT